MAILDLWLPILVAAVFVFIASSILHMVIPIHKGDFTKMDGEAEVMASMRTQGVEPGNYMFPCASSMKEMTSPEMIEKLNQGPVGFMNVYPNGPMNMGKSLGQWFVYCIVISVVVAYLTGIAYAPGAGYPEIFRFAGTVAILGYGLNAFTESIWKGVKWSTSFKFLFDGIVYGLVTGGAFGWLWPAAM
ncbi:MAG: hypothetical protein ACYTG5_18690 [Planctomycetota bacterium]|jgi:hypothetical protein